MFTELVVICIIIFINILYKKVQWLDLQAHMGGCAMN